MQSNLKWNIFDYIWIKNLRAWKTHIEGKRRQLDLKICIVTKKYNNNLWRNTEYGRELWDCSKPSNPKILQIFQSKTLWMTAAPCSVFNQTPLTDFRSHFIKESHNNDNSNDHSSSKNFTTAIINLESWKNYDQK